MQFSLLALNLARCKQINRSINAHFVLTPIRYQQLHIYKCVCVSVCSLWHTWLAECAHSGGARDFRCMLPQDTERYEYSMRSQKNCCTWAKQRTQKRRTSNTAAKVHTTFNNNNQQQQQQQLQFNYVLCFVRCFVVDLWMSVSFAQCGPNIDSLGALLADNQMCIFLQLCVTVRVRSTWIESVPLSVHVCRLCVYRCVFVVSTVVIIISIGMCELELVPTATS